jgi:hypothetical protein
MAELSAPGTNPALSLLAFLVGEWRTEVSNASFLPDRSTALRGHTSFSWLEDGAFLAMRQFQSPSGPPQAVLVIGRDQGEADYEVLYFDRRPMSRIYHMSFDGKVWRMWREAPGFWQRFECTVPPDKRSLTGHWDKSTDDGSTWEHDFDIRYFRD